MDFPRTAPVIRARDVEQYFGIGMIDMWDLLPGRSWDGLPRRDWTGTEADAFVRSDRRNLPIDPGNAAWLDVQRDNAAARALTRELRRLFAGRGLSAASLATAARLFLDYPYVLPPRATFLADVDGSTLWTRGVAARAAHVAMSMWAQRARIAPGPFPLRIIDILVGGGTDRELRGAIERHLRPGQRKPNVVILTPLGGLTDAAQEVMVERAAIIEKAVRGTASAQVMIPGDTMHPSSDHSADEPIDLYAAARAKVIDADVVFVVAGPHDSWGNAICVTLAESLNTDVLVFRDGHAGFSKVLSTSFFRSKTVPSGTPAEDAETASAFVQERIDSILEHLRFREEFLGRVLPQMASLREALRSTEITSMTDDRVGSILANPSELMTLSAVELAALLDELGDRREFVVQLLTGYRTGATDNEIAEALDTFIRDQGDVTEHEEAELWAQLSQIPREHLGVAARHEWDVLFLALLDEIRRDDV